MIRRPSIYIIILMLLCVAALIIHHLGYFYGHFGFDDMHYAHLSADLMHGQIDYSDHYSFRWPILALTALSYTFFGISDTSSAIPALLLSSCILALMAYVFRRRPIALLITVLLFFSIRWNVFYTDKLMPDIYLSCFLFVAWITYLSIRKRAGGLASVLFPACLFLAFLSKGTVILMVPLLLYYLASDAKANNIYLWKKPLVVGTGILAIYLVICYILTGDPLARFNAIEVNSYYNECSYSLMPISHTVERLTTGFLELIWEESLILFLVLAIAGRVIAWRRQLASEEMGDVRFYTNTVFVLFLSMNFMTFSLTSYNPGCLDIRHYLFCVPIMSSCIGFTWMALGLPRRFAAVFIGCLVLCLLPTYKLMTYGRTLHFSETKKDIQHIIKQMEEDTATYVTNPAMVNMIAYYSGFSMPNRTLKVASYHSGACTTDCYLIANWYSEFHSQISFDQIKKTLEGTTITEINGPLNDQLTRSKIYHLSPNPK